MQHPTRHAISRDNRETGLLFSLNDLLAAPKELLERDDPAEIGAWLNERRKQSANVRD